MSEELLEQFEDLINEKLFDLKTQKSSNPDVNDYLALIDIAHYILASERIDVDIKNPLSIYEKYENIIEEFGDFEKDLVFRNYLTLLILNQIRRFGWLVSDTGYFIKRVPIETMTIYKDNKQSIGHNLFLLIFKNLVVLISNDLNSKSIRYIHKKNIKQYYNDSGNFAMITKKAKSIIKTDNVDDLVKLFEKTFGLVV